MPKKANLEDLAELRNRPGKMSCIKELIWNSMQINGHTVWYNGGGSSHKHPYSTVVVIPLFI